MRLGKKLKKMMGFMLISTMILSAAPVMAADYDTHWAKEAITKWSDYDVVAGYGEGIFKPNEQVKRSELAAFITRVFGLESTTGATNFTDVSASAWYAQDVAKVSAAGIMQGASGKFNPDGFATRQEVAVTLVNAFSLTGSGNLNFADQAEIADWAKEAVAALASNGYAKGQAGNKFAPKANITRAEVVQLLDNIVEELVNKPGTYTNSIKGNVVVNTKDTVLEGMTVSGNIYLAQGIALGDATLKNTKVEGEVIVAGGGIDSLHFNQVTVNKGVRVKAAHSVRLVAEGSKIAVKAEKGQTIVLTGTFSEVVVPAGTVLDLKSATVDKITVVAGIGETATITLSKDSVVQEILAQNVVNIKGTGKIVLLTVEANGVTSVIKPDKTTVKPGTEAPSLPASGGGGGGTTGGNNNSEDKDDSAVDYATVKAITVMGEGDKKVQLSDKAIKIEKGHITLNLRGLINEAPTSITGGTVTFNNLKAGDEITFTEQTKNEDPLILTWEVEDGGMINYSVADVVAEYDAQKQEMIDQLISYELYDKIQSMLAKFDLSLEEEYLVDGSLNTATVAAKFEKALALLDENKDNLFIKALIEVLEEDGTVINVAGKSVTSKVNVKAGKFDDIEYTVTINY